MPFTPLRDGQQLYTRVIGRGQPVLVLSGLGMQSSHWLPFFAPYLHQFKFYIPDFRGFGGSKQTSFLDRTDVFSSHMQDVEDVVTHFQLNDFRVIGYSLGATTAMHWMQFGNFRQLLIKGYLHIDQTPCIHNTTDWSYGLLGDQQPLFLQSLQQLLTLLSRHPTITSISEFPRVDKQLLLDIWGNTLASMLGKKIPKILLRLAPHQQHIFKLLVPFSNASYMSMYLNAYLNQRNDYRSVIASTDIPMTFFIGEQSQLYAAEGQRLIAQSAKQPTTVMFEKSGHTPLFNEPVKFVKELGRFLNQL